jgi:hypothetical protein
MRKDCLATKDGNISGIRIQDYYEKTLEQMSTQKIIDSLEYSTTGLVSRKWLWKDKSLIVGVI